MAMAASKAQALVVVAVLTISSAITAYCARQNKQVSVYWGQYSEREEGSLQEACSSGNYNIVILSNLIIYDNRHNPTLNLANHCGSPSNPCTKLERQIKHCQDNDVKIFLSLEPKISPSNAKDDDDEEGGDVTDEVSDFIVKNFLSGKPGPLGTVTLDGIDIQHNPDSKHLSWDKLVESLKNSKSSDDSSHPFFISAATQCVYPDPFLDSALQTGKVDYIWVQFFNSNPCIYSNDNPRNLLNAWETWTTNFPHITVFLGVTANQNMLGFIEPKKLKDQVLNKVKKSHNYGGVMIWDRNADAMIDYGGKIKGEVNLISCTCVSCEPDDHDQSPNTAFTRKLARS